MPDVAAARAVVLAAGGSAGHRERVGLEQDDPPALDAPQQMGLFAAPRSALAEALESLDPDELTPRQALEALYRLRQLR